MSRDRFTTGRYDIEYVLDSAADELEPILDFVPLDEQPLSGAVMPSQAQMDIDALRIELRVTAERLECEAAALRRQFEALEESERPRWYH